MIYLVNDFHEADIALRKRIGQTIARSTLLRVRRGLCGIDDCNCGQDAANQSGPDMTVRLVELPDGRALIQRA